MERTDALIQTVLRKAREYAKKLWVRVVIMGTLAFVALGLTQLVEPFVPDKLATSLSGQAADRLLDIIANAMLAVTIFSITVMVSVYRASSSQFTPRVHRLIIEDPTTQNTLAVFIGAYVYALVGIILRELGVYVDDRAFVLFLMTVGVLVVIVVSLIRWVLHLQSFGSLMDTSRQLEAVTRRRFKERLATPCLGAHALTDATQEALPEDARTVCAQQSGYVQHIYPEALDAAARAHGVNLYFIRNIGSFVFVNEPLVRVVSDGEPQTEAQEHAEIDDAIAANVVLGDTRTYDQDPRFGLTVLGEVASKALSPGINDPGTAIDVITRVGRVLSDYRDEEAEEREIKLDHLYISPLSPVDLLDDGFGALMRDGAHLVEVQMRLIQTLQSLMRHPDPGLCTAAEDMIEAVLVSALPAMPTQGDVARLCALVSDEMIAKAQAQIDASN